MKNMVTISVALALLAGASGIQAKELSMVVQGVIHNQPELSGKEVKIHLAYDSEHGITEDAEMKPMQNYSLPSEYSILKIEVDGVTYLGDFPHTGGSFIDAVVENRPDSNDIDFIRFSSNHPYRQIGGEFTYIDSVHLDFQVKGLSSVNLPDSIDAFNQPSDVPPSHLSFNLNGQSVNANITGVYSSLDAGCMRQTTYDIVAEAPGQNPTPENPNPIVTLNASLTLSPGYTVNESSFYRDFGYSSKIELEYFGVTYRSIQSSREHNISAIDLHSYDRQLNIISPILNADGFPDGAVDINLTFFNSLNEKLPKVLRLEEMGQLNFHSPQGPLTADIKSIKISSGSCSVVPYLRPNPQSVTIPFPGAGHQEYVLIPETGGYLYLDREFVNGSDEAQKIRRWAVIEMPNGQMIPHGGAGTRKIEPGMPLQELETRFNVPKFWPNGLYTYHLYTLSHDQDIVPEATSIRFYKGEPKF
ncbi:hypothetical protein [Pleionea sp. CnH1-48]|uniref:hypothetical protein n=1 Tax=Pleionea sp. CnH1-48 TaxID=2954494 RepID=UPI002097C5FD|nr:hypothetical protein [Pleionea sp. CnH1-48]MCO7224490.1 hypothetical protein [Pleionea sp. CnH1-48]